jgi:hypothetical protein
MKRKIKNQIKIIRIIFINFVKKHVGLQKPLKADQEIPEFLESTQFENHCSMRCPDLPCHLLRISLERVFCHSTFIYAKTLYPKCQTEPCSIFSFVCVCVGGGGGTLTLFYEFQNYIVKLQRTLSKKQVKSVAK